MLKDLAKHYGTTTICTFCSSSLGVQCKHMSSFLVYFNKLYVDVMVRVTCRTTKLKKKGMRFYRLMILQSV